MATVRFIMDTNVILQCADLAGLTWSDITDAENVELVVASTVMQEVDRLKSDGNARRARRARAF